MSSKFNNKFRTALFKIGHILPETTQEIEEFDKIISDKDLPNLPNIFDNPSQIVKQGKSILKSNPEPLEMNQEETNKLMAQAAREGKKEVSQEIKDKMAKDRRDAKKKN
ncbi:hypothetical protein AB1A65_16030 [Muricauda sp. ANG21]|uniref:hypothetical protein n=1 Tax=Allomuricauda sp. ANG21 TaxID=3042468 RepID=UPI003451D547